MNAVKEPPIVDYNTELTLVADRFREASVAEKEALREVCEKRCADIDQALIQITLAIRSVAGMPSMLQAGEDDEVAIGAVLKRLAAHARGDERKDEAA